MNKYLLILVAAVLALFAGVVPTHASTVFTVNSPADKPDTAPGDGNCHTKANTCTLRAAVQEANALGTPVTIQLAATTYTLKRTGTDDTALRGDLDLKGNMIIKGVGAAQTIIQGKS